MVDADNLRRASPWTPITSSVQLALLGKLVEELAEACSAASRCIIQGVGESEPVTGKPNRAWLEDEIADVEAGIELVKNYWGLDRKRVARRRVAKIDHLQEWHAQLTNCHRPQGHNEAKG